MLRRWLPLPIVVLCLAGAAWYSQEPESAGVRMTAAAEKFVASLKEDQKARALFAFDDKERTNWHFVPLQDKGTPLRKGLRLDQMSADQKNLVLELLKAGTSPTGYAKATTIMSLENILADLEKGKGTQVRDPGWYFVSVFGEPARNGRWGWRVEGHHLSINFTVDRGKVVGATPFFFGANPAIVREGPRKGLQTLPEAEDYALELYGALDEEQRKVARQDKQFPEIEEGKAKPNVGEPVGIPFTKLNDRQRFILTKLVEGYAERMPPDVAAAELAGVRQAGLDKVYFAFAREDKPGLPYTYRVQGPTFVIEFLNVQADSAGNPSNHIHSAWRHLGGDFGLER